MAKTTNECPRCGLSVAGGQHQTPDDCLTHLVPRYQLAQASLKAMHARYRTLEERLERAKIGERLARQQAKKNATVPARLEAIERRLGIGVRNEAA